MPKNKKLILPVNSVDFEIMGIITNNRDYSFCSKLNKIFNFNFTLHKLTIERFLKNNDAQFFTFFYKDEDSDVDYFLLNNTGVINSEKKNNELFNSDEKKIKIIEEYANIEMFIIIYDEAQNYSLEEIKKQIKSNTDAETISINTEKLKEQTIQYIDYLISSIRHTPN